MFFWLQSCSNPGTFLLGRDAVADSNTRSLWDIVSACLTTIFACPWIAVHSNIPAPEDSAIDILSRRLAIMGNLLILPEFVLMWATRQYVASLEICKRHKGRGWTKTHAFFAIIGFALFEDGAYIRILEVTDLERLESEGMIDWPNITAEEIKDKSKGDYFSKAVVVLQTTWFIVQCIIRGFEKLVVTELEVVMLAFSFLTMVIYFMWWNKPLDVGVPSRVYLKKGFSAKDIFKDSSKDSHSQIVEKESEPVGNLDPSIPVVIGETRTGEEGPSTNIEDANFSEPRQLQENKAVMTEGQGLLESLPNSVHNVPNQIAPEAVDKEQDLSTSNSSKIDVNVVNLASVCTTEGSTVTVLSSDQQSDQHTRSGLLPAGEQRPFGEDIRINMETSSSLDPQSLPSSDPQLDNETSSSFILEALSAIFVLLFLPLIYVAYSILYSVVKFVLFFTHPVLRLPPKVFLKFLYFIFVFLPVESVRAVEDMASCVSLSKKTKRRVPTFYSPNVSDTAGYLVLLAVGIVFGGIHCIAWPFHFPTETERLLWRVTFVVITASPAAIMTCGLMLPDDDFEDDEAPMQIHSWMILLLIFIIIAPYIASRLCLIFLPLFSLRALPSGAFADINWTLFIPHIHT